MNTLTIGAGLGGICLLSTRAAKRVRVLEAATLAGIERFVPAQPPQTTVLREAMKSVGEALYGRRRKQPLAIRRLDLPNQFECVRVVSVPGQQRNRYDFLFSAEIKDWQASVLDTGLPLSGTWPASYEVSHSLREQVDYRRTYLPGPIVSQVLVRGLKSWGALSLIDHGGAWFLDGRYLDQYRAFANHLRQQNDNAPDFRVTQFEIASDPDTVSHVLDLLHAEVTAGVNEIMADVMAAQGGMSDRSIDVRVKRANAFMAKVQQYESMLGRPLPDLTDAIAQARSAVAVNRLLAAAV